MCVFVIISSLFLLLCRQLSNQCEQTRSPVKFQSSHSLQSRSLVSWWVVSYPSAASSFSFSSFSTAFGKQQECCLSWLVGYSCFDQPALHSLQWALCHMLSLIFQVSSDVLHVRVPVPGFHYSAHHMLRGHNSALLLPPLCWGTWVFTGFCLIYQASVWKILI